MKNQTDLIHQLFTAYNEKIYYSVLLGLLHDSGEVANVSFGVRILEENSGDVLLWEVGLQDVLNVDLDSKRQGSSCDATK